MTPKSIDLGTVSCLNIVPKDTDGLAEELDRTRTVVTDFDGAVVLRLEQLNPDALDLLAGQTGVLRRREGACPTRTQNADGAQRVCCRSVHSDPWHIDGRWPTTPFRADEYGRFLGEVSR